MSAVLCKRRMAAHDGQKLCLPCDLRQGQRRPFVAFALQKHVRIVIKQDLDAVAAAQTHCVVQCRLAEFVLRIHFRAAFDKKLQRRQSTLHGSLMERRFLVPITIVDSSALLQRQTQNLEKELSNEEE